MSGQDEFETALAGLQLPAEWHLDVAIRPRRRSVGIEVLPGGAVVVLIPPTADPEQVAWFVRSHRRWIIEKVETAPRLAPDHSVKGFVDSEEFDLLGERYRLQLVDSLPSGVGQSPAATADHVLYARRQRPEQVRRAVIELYRQVGLSWLKREGRQYELAGGIEGLDYVVRGLGRRRWGAYYGPPKHTTTLHWAAFGLPVHLVEYVLVHEQAHATRPPGQAHGPAWRRQMNLWMPDWKQRKTELAEIGRHAWLGD
ncbi:M48 family metallopeptidase [Amycolatopsis sp. cmx-11-12]|uniref:M48 family metallopeptidase n=1 Tax=Amycolatopsis sp. cmx-11-12 TaxID=2785795 RepID=UPI00391725CE